ncbi:hypothetical protein [Promicromonospora sp. NPDC019610]|uniref:hypothetical protein n=1 Tax=Promicromonospora sp. NPDC019610 TaxID=3364405 RepID=UPI00378E9676
MYGADRLDRAVPSGANRVRTTPWTSYTCRGSTSAGAQRDSFTDAHSRAEQQHQQRVEVGRGLACDRQGRVVTHDAADGLEFARLECDWPWVVSAHR